MEAVRARCWQKSHWFPPQLNNLFCRLWTLNYTYSQLLINKMYDFKLLKTSRNKFTVFKDLKSDGKENVFIDELALTQSLKVHFKIKIDSAVVKIMSVCCALDCSILGSFRICSS